MANAGILHPGLMGISVAATMQNSGSTVYWASAGRSPATRERAEAHHLRDAKTLANLCRTCEIIVSVCPPDAAEEMVGDVAACGFDGLYIDANAISPGRAVRIEQELAAVGATMVDGSIIGGPAWTPGETFLYLSGTAAEDAARYFAAGPLEARIIGDSVGKASALKMCFAAYSKGTIALLSAVLALANNLGVEHDLERQWGSFFSETQERARKVTAKAWRFEGEMAEIANTFSEAGLPSGFHVAAGEVYRRLAGFKDAPEVPALEDVLSALLDEQRVAG